MIGYDFTGKRILLAGLGGIGTAIADELLDAGARLCAVDYSENNIESIRVAHPNRGIVSAICDFSQVERIESTIKALMAGCGVLDGVVFAAGVGSVRPLRMSKYDFMLRVLNINFFAFIELIRILTQRQYCNPQGMNIVAISALGAYMGNSTKTAYCSSKAAMNAAVRCMAKELAPRNIRINTVAPGVTDTPMFRSAQDYGTESEAFKQILDRQYLGICAPKDIADSVMFLLSDFSRKITGSCLPVDGGKLSS